MFLEQVRIPTNTFLKYVMGTLVFFFFTLIGQIPITQAILSVSEGAFDPSNSIGMMNSLPSNQRLFLQMLPFVVSFFGLWFVCHFLHQQKFITLFTSRKTLDWKRVFFSFWIWGIASVALLLVSYALAPEEYILNFRWKTFIPLFFLGVLLIPIQTTSEELLFRGYLLQGFGVLFKNRWAPLLVTSVLFGSLHFANPEVAAFGLGIMLYYIGTGFFLGMISLIDEGLELAIGFHAANNLFGALLISSEWSAFQTEAAFVFKGQPSLWSELIVSIGVCFPLLFYVFYKKYEWSSIIKKLT